MKNVPKAVESIQLLRIRDLAELFNCSPKTIRRWHNAGKLPEPFRVQGSNMWRWKMKDISEWINQQGRMS